MQSFTIAYLLDKELSRTIRGTLGFFENEKIIIEWKKNQMQSGVWQCGYFSLANAMAPCLDLKPEELIFDELVLRSHFIDIVFGNKELEMFPHIEINKNLKQKNKLFFLEKDTNSQ